MFVRSSNICQCTEPKSFICTIRSVRKFQNRFNRCCFTKGQTEITGVNRLRNNSVSLLLRPAEFKLGLRTFRGRGSKRQITRSTTVLLKKLEVAQASHETLHPLRNPKVRHSVHNSEPTFTILIEIHSITSTLFPLNTLRSNTE